MNAYENQDNSGDEFDPNEKSRRRQVKPEVDSQVDALQQPKSKKSSGGIGLSLLDQIYLNDNEPEF